MISSQDEGTESVLTPEIEGEIQKALDRRKLDFYAPYPKQLDFHAASRQYRERLLMAGNQCNLLSNTIETGHATRQIRELVGAGQFDVQSWDGNSRCNRRASPVFLRGIERAYLLQLDNGQRVAFSAAHRLLTTTGWMSVAQFVRSSSGVRGVVDDHRPLQSNGHDWMQRVEDYLANCAIRFRHDDARSPVRKAFDRAGLPLQGDAPEHNRRLGMRDLERDGAGRTQECNRGRQWSCHLPIQNAARLLEALCERWEDRTSEYDVRWPRHTLRAWSQYTIECALRRARCATGLRQPLGAADLAAILESHAVEETTAPCEWGVRARRQSVVWCDPGQVTLECLATEPGTEIFFPYDTPLLVGGSRIIAVIPLEVQPIVDITVPGTHAYMSEGLISHNCGKTVSAGAETAIYATGMYPSWWPGRRYDRPTNFWVGSPTGQTLREGPQRILLGEIGEWGTGMIPGRSIIDIRKAIHGSSDQVESILVRHEPTGKISRLLLKTYDQGRIRWQGATIDGVWFDEEPPEDVYSEGKTRTVVLNGLVYLTFTPLLGMTEVVTRYLKEQPPGSVVIRMGIADAKHFSPERQAEIIAGYPAHEREARAQGEPILGSGRVFPIDPEDITESPIQIPDYWPRVAGIDIGWDHPTAVVWLAWDRDVDCVHVYDTYRMKEQTPVVHAAAIKAKGPWIPMAWPHDGHQHDKGSGKMIAEQYRRQGVLMLPMHATHKPEPGKKEGTAGYSLEAGVSDMLMRMQTGRWKVSSLCADWFNEYRMYYRKDGQIVKKGDDLMSASRVANMMLRFARVRLVRPDAPVLPGFFPTDAGMGNLG